VERTPSDPQTVHETDSAVLNYGRPGGAPAQSFHAATPPAVKAVVQRNRGTAIRITVGFDFGTHSTKVLYRKHGDTVTRILYLDEPCKEYPSFASPSLVRLDNDGRLWFGSETLLRNSGHLHRSLKVRLLGPDRESSLEPFPPGPTPQFLVAAYLAWAFHRVRDKLQAEFGAHALRMNLAAPMNHVQNERLRDVYLHIVQTAWQATFGECPLAVDQGVRLDAVQRPFTRLLDSKLVPESERHFEVLPETIAPIVSMSFNPRMAPGFYLIVDMGGGTTEISVNMVGKSKKGQNVHCYFDDLIHLGGNDFAALAVKEASAAAAGRLRLLDRTCAAIRKVWYGGYEKEKEAQRTIRARWKDLYVLLSGGGTRNKEVADRIRQCPPQRYIFVADPCKYVVGRYEPANIDPGLHQVSDVDLSLLSVAHGLALEAQRWPELLKPVEVQAFDPAPRAERPEAYWYVGGK
jgi:hypothetical protein